MPTTNPNPGGARPKKGLGQNFLINPAVAPKMIEQSGLDSSYGVLEIGPGRGALTKHLVESAKLVVAVELDAALAKSLPAQLGEPENLVIVEGDVLKLDLAALLARYFGDMRVAVFGNLPYYITSPILMKLLEERLPVEFITAMVQKEAAQRLCAAPATRQSGAVTLAVNYYAEPEILFDVSSGSFYPAPKVTSSVIKLTRRETPAVFPRSARAMFAVIKAAYAQRRKRAVNAIAGGLGAEKAAVEAAFARLGIDANARAENLSLAQFAALSDEIAHPEEQ